MVSYGSREVQKEQESPVSLLVLKSKSGIGPEHHVKRLGKRRFLTKWRFWTILVIIDESGVNDDY